MSTDTAAADGLRIRRRAVIMAGLVSLVSLAAGAGLAQVVVSPSDAAARTAPPEPSLITAPVERRALVSAIVTRGDVGHDEVEDVTVEAGALETPPVVTGALPAAGDLLEAGDVVLELAGRPVVALGGDLPTYRSLGPGTSGPDVRQLRRALDALGIEAGALDDDTYDAAVATAVEALYERIGYAAPAPPKEADQALEQAAEQLRAAEAQLRAAERALAAARQGPGEVERLQADAMVRAAERAVVEAKRPGEDGEVDRRTVEDAEEQLTIARAQREQQLAPIDVSAERAEVDLARQLLERSREDLADARTAVRTPLPGSEVVFLPDLPRRVDRVEVALGDRIDGPVLRAGARRMVVRATLSEEDAVVLEAGAEAELEVEGRQVPAVVREVRARQDEGGEGYEAVVEPVDPDALTDSDGRNLRVTFPLETTDGEVLVVPLAALRTSADGEARVDVEGADGVLETVQVEVGLATGPDVEVSPIAGGLEVGDRVVVGG